MPPSLRGYPAKLSASVGAPGPHDFTVRKPPLVRAMIAPGALRPSHPVPNVRDDRDTPLLWDGMADSIMLILANREAEYFCEDDWTGFCAACPSGKSPLAAFLLELKALGKADAP